MPEILVQRDNLDEVAERFDRKPLEQGVFLNSIPKSGSHLLRNILRMFVPTDQTYTADFIQWGNLQAHRSAFDPASPKLSWGHLFFADASVIETAHVRRILLYRDPYDWVIARARFILSEQFRGNVDHLRTGVLSSDELLTMMIFGLPQKLPSLNDIYELNAAAWLGARCHVVKYEELVSYVQDTESSGAAEFFSGLLGACGIATPNDWAERVKAGSARGESATARENLTGVTIDLPETLPEKHRALVDYQAPCLRKLLGYN
ncbi:hypothetical protein [Aurantiacibacter zhengii]|uniref:Sulfotransferase domain-containing protein n=1 Tax=Aurantiacibacter zhengii TaxID=2307003 RepID=A0A418NR87_9SPHN|nr:hypothetical protein [Aurantiacibacter zhengii]RIV85654.1 hypothetical protein D2V07_09925 [Aurantiacibacter zhengii]